MKNPLKKLRDRTRGHSRTSLDTSSNLTTGEREDSPDSETSSQPMTSTRSEPAQDADVSVEATTPVSVSKRSFTGMLRKGKSAAMKTVTFMQGGTPPKSPTMVSTPENDIEEHKPFSFNTIRSSSQELPVPVNAVPEKETPNGVQTQSEDDGFSFSPIRSGGASTSGHEVREEEDVLPEAEVKEIKPRSLEIEEQPSHSEKEPELPPPPVVKPSEPKDVTEIHSKTVFMALFGVCTFNLFVMIAIFGVDIWETVWYSFLSLGVTLGLCYLYSRNRMIKERKLEMLSLTPGVSGLRFLFQTLPTWISHTKTERVEWLNKAMEEMWPFYDKAVCDAIKDSVEPIMRSIKPPIFKDIHFARLRFGDVPFRIEGVEVNDITESEIVLDIDIRWCGDANVTLSIDPNIPSMTDVTKMQPKITNISCYGTLRLIFKPLVSTLPGFGAIVITFPKPPVIRFNCDFGRALGGSVSGNMVRSALDSFIKDTLANMYVWPQRYVAPIIYDEDVTGPIEDLQLRYVGLLIVKVIEARDLPAADLNGTSDPTIEFWTHPKRKHNTSVIKRTLNPKWDDETLRLLVQEPRSQTLNATAYDVDILNVSEVFKSINIIKNLKESVYAKEFLGRASIPLRPVTAKPNEEVDEWYDLGPHEFSHPEGPGRGCGTLRLKMCYKPFADLNPELSKKGAIIITVIRCRDLMAMDHGGTSDPYVRIKIGDKVFKTHVISATCDPEFHVTFEFFDVPISEMMHFSVFDRDFASKDDPLGTLEISVRQLASKTTDLVPGSVRQWFPLKGVEHGEIQLKMQYISMDVETAQT